MPAMPWTEASLDFLTSLPTVDGKSTILVVVCHFSKMLILIPLGDMTDAESVAAAFSHALFVCMICPNSCCLTMIRGLLEKCGPS